MSKLALRVQNLGKLYRIGRTRNKKLRDALATTADLGVKTVRLALSGDLPRGGRAANTIWALRNVTFDVRRGEIVGIIGRNGSGKSTLLKLLSRVTVPTEGRVEGYGRVRSLLEVGTGFHPELTGRENIYLNGAVLGMARVEIDRKFDEIVAFSEVEQFLDTPVKHFSSGMYVRLAFSVAAHLEPEILIIDEVLAVGDSAFQKKCLGKMNEVATRDGRTVLFVSHNMAAVQSLCERALWLDTGRLVGEGVTNDIVRSYLQSVTPDQETPLADRADRAGDGSVRFTSLRIESLDSGRVIFTDSRLKITLAYRSEVAVLHPGFVVSVHDSASSSALFGMRSEGMPGFPESLPAEGQVTCVTEPINLTPGRCYVNVALKKGPSLADQVQYAAFFDVEDRDIAGTGKTPHRSWVLTLVPHEWIAGGNGP